MKPILISFGEFKLYSYPLFIGAAWGISYQFCLHLLKKLNIDSDGFRNFAIGLFVSAWLGSKLLFIVVSNHLNRVDLLGSVDFWLGGGLVFYGGLIFGIIFSFIYIYLLKKISTKIVNVLIPGLSLGHAIGRVGCFFAGCCYGVACDLPWAIKVHGIFRHPVQLYEAIFSLFMSILFYRFVVNGNKSDKYIVSLYILSYSAFRFSIEFLRGDISRGIYFGGAFSTSQIVSLCLMIMSIIFLGLEKYKKIKQVQ